MIRRRRDASSRFDPLTDSDLASYALDQFVRVIADSVLEHRLDVLDVFDLLGGIALDQNEVRILAGCEGTDAILLAEIGRAIRGPDLDGFNRGESGFDQQFYFALIAEPRKRAAIPGRDRDPRAIDRHPSQTQLQTPSLS